MYDGRPIGWQLLIRRFWATIGRPGILSGFLYRTGQRVRRLVLLRRALILAALAPVACRPSPTNDVVVFRLNKSFGIESLQNGRDIDLVWDTGSELSFLTQRTVLDNSMQTRLLAHPISLCDSTGQRRIVSEEATTPDLPVLLGRPRLERLPILPDPGAWFRFDGIVGRNVIMSWDWIIDVARGNVIRLGRGTAEDHFERHGFAAQGSLPYRVCEDGIYVDIRLGGRISARARLDTGAWSTMLPKRLIDDLGLRPGEDAERAATNRDAELIAEKLRSIGVNVGRPTVSTGATGIMGVHGKEVTSAAFILEAIEIAGVTEESLVIHVALGDTVLIGADLLRRWAWALDNEAHIMWLLRK